jgi:hypothetical protein
MQQATLAFPAAPIGPTNAIDRTGFELGWDHAHHGLVPPAELLLQGTPVCQGWMAGKAVFGRRPLASTRAVRQWLLLRTGAWRRGISFEGQQLTPHSLQQIEVQRYPVLRLPLGGAPGTNSAAVIDRVDLDGGYSAGNLAVLSNAAAQARECLSVADAVRRARLAELSGEPVHGQPAGVWWRLALLRSFATPLPFHEAARLPLRLLPPKRVYVLNAAQRLQVLLTLQFSTPGWSQRARSLATLLPEPTLRHDFNLFIGAIAPRVLEAGAWPDAPTLRCALEDAWGHERVQRRWQHFVLQLGGSACETLLQRTAEAGLASVSALGRAATAGNPPTNKSATTGARAS